MKFVAGVLSYIFAWSAVISVAEALTTMNPFIWGLSIILFILSGLLSSYSKSEFNLDPIGFIVLIRGLISLYVYFSVPSVLFIIMAIVYFIMGALVLKIPSLINKRRNKSESSIIS